MTILGFQLRFPRATLAISVLLAGFYFFFSNSLGFIPVLQQQEFAFNLFSAPANLFSFLLVHTGVMHLLGNLVLIVCFGFVVEQCISSRHVTAIFFACGILSFGIFNLLYPTAFGIGASGGAVALVTAGLLLSPPKGIVALVASIVVLFVLGLGFQWYSDLQETHLVAAQATAKTELETAISSQDPVRIASTQQQVAYVNHQIAEKASHDEYVLEIPIGHLVHLFASLLAVGYLLVFCPKPFSDSASKNRRLIRDFVRLRKTAG